MKYLMVTLFRLGVISLLLLGIVACDDSFLGGSSKKSSSSDNNDSSDTQTNTATSTSALDTGVRTDTATATNINTGVNTGAEPETYVRTDAFDGVYSVTFKRNDLSALGEGGDTNFFLKAEVQINNGRGNFEIETKVNDTPVQILGVIEVEADGTVHSDIDARKDGEIVASVDTDELLIQGDTFSGSYFYQVGSEVIGGEVRAVRISEKALAQRELVDEFDGTYQVDFIKVGSEEEVQTRVCLEILAGKVSQTIEDDIAIAGSVSRDGGFLLLSSKYSKRPLVAEGVITQFDITGNYEIQSGTSKLLGKKVNVCITEDVESPDGSNDDDDTETVTTTDTDTQPQPYLLCEADVDLTGDGALAIVQGILATLTKGDRLYCTSKLKCKFLDELLQSMESRDACLTECQRLAENNAQFKPGCLGELD